MNKYSNNYKLKSNKDTLLNIENNIQLNKLKNLFISSKNNESGITMIALVVTIVVLLILAGISLGALTGDNGIINKAQEAKNDTNYAQWEEKIDQAIIDAESKHRNPGIGEVTQELIDKGIIKDASQVAEDGTITTMDGTIIEGKLDDYILPPLEPGVIVSDGPREYTKGEQTAWIPDGYMIVPGLDNIDAGLVISDNPNDTEIEGQETVAKGNQFVWIPVPDVIYDGSTEISKTYTPMVEKQGSSTDYQGMLYKFSGSTSTYQSGYKPGTTTYREPSLVTENSSDTYARVSSVTGTRYDASSSYYNTILGYSSAMEFGAAMQDDFNSMVESVNKYKGFYVGRYELGLEGTTPVVKNASTNTGVTTAYSSNSSNSNTYRWYGLYSKCKEFAPEESEESVVSSMIWGSQYDAMLNWMAKQGETVGTSNTSKRNSTKVTGSNANDVIKKVFDLYGCNYEWTLEASSTSSRVNRGGSSISSSNSPSARYYSPTDTIGSLSARLTLYIK